MEDLENIRLNINSSIVKLKREWNSVRKHGRIPRQENMKKNILLLS